MTDDALAYLMAEAGPPTIKFPAIGDIATGTVLAYELNQQTEMGTLRPLTFDDGRPRMQIVFTLQTERRDPEIEGDDGKRRLFCKAKMLQAVKQAIKDSNVDGDIKGGMLEVKYTGNDQPSKPGLNAPKVFVARFTPQAQSAQVLEVADESEEWIDDDPGPF